MLRSRRWCFPLVLVFALLVVGPLNDCRAYTPESPEVIALLQKAVRYLEAGKLEGNATMIGGETLVGLSIYKYHRRYNSAEKLPPRTKTALDKARAAARNARGITSMDNYSLGITLIFLTEVKPDENKTEINALLAEVLKRQMGNGGWGYNAATTGDTSQTQYAVLGLWSAHNAGLKVPPQSMEKVLSWLMRTQDPGGAWGYQGKDPGGGARVKQEEITHSLHAAGLSSVYVIADFLGFSKGTGQAQDPDAEFFVIEIPPALIPVFEDAEGNEQTKEGKPKVKVVTSIKPGGRMGECMHDGDGWYAKNYKIKTRNWQFYYMYALERYQSFKELVDGTYVSEPVWYNEGVEFLQDVQLSNGIFRAAGTSESGGDMVDTAFAVLFLLRSTKETIDRVVHNEGFYTGGRGLPEDASNVRLNRDNKIVAPKITVEVGSLLEMLEDDENAEKFDDMVKNPAAYSIQQMKGDTRDFTARLKRILRSGKWQARILAAHTLGRQGDLDNVPILIFALTDGDPRVVLAARDGLRLTSRRFDGFGLPDKPTTADINMATKRWRDWYQSIRPDAGFIEIPNVTQSGVLGGGGSP